LRKWFGKCKWTVQNTRCVGRWETEGRCKFPDMAW
jgi:hypothetical protein